MPVSDRIVRRVSSRPWDAVRRHLDDNGWAHLPKLLTATECATLRRLYDVGERFRSTVDMQRHGFGRGQYRYFGYPLPPLVQGLRQGLYGELAPLANDWMKRLRRDGEYPPALGAFLARCHRRGQLRPTPLLLRYGDGDFNRLHQDIYGDVQFPLQALVLLSQHGRDYDGGEVVFVEQRPRLQSRPIVLVPDAGDVVIFTNKERPARGTRGNYAVQVRHGASELRGGERFVLGVIFHDAA
jgi:hypothetical protein